MTRLPECLVRRGAVIHGGEAIRAGEAGDVADVADSGSHHDWADTNVRSRSCRRWSGGQLPSGVTALVINAAQVSGISASSRRPGPYSSSMIEIAAAAA